MKIRYKAFTLLEMTIAMLIAAICMGIAFYVLSTFTRLSGTQQHEKQANFLLQLFQHRMQKEFLEADYIQFADSTLVLNQTGRQIAYIFSGTALIRNQNGIPTDTLFGQVEDIAIEYIENIPQELVKTCYFELETDNGRYPFVYRKVYSAENLVCLTTEQ